MSEIQNLYAVIDVMPDGKEEIPSIANRPLVTSSHEGACWSLSLSIPTRVPGYQPSLAVKKKLVRFTAAEVLEEIDVD